MGKIQTIPQPIIALDFSSPSNLRNVFVQTRDLVQTFKIGPVSLLHGSTFPIFEILLHGKDIFLDLKVHEIPKTLYAVIKWCDENRIKFLTITYIPGVSNYKLPVTEFTKFLAVNLLTSSPTMNLIDTDWILQVADLGFHGMILPAKFAKRGRKFFPEGLVVSPGLRPSKDHDHTFSFSPAECALHQPDYFVVGKPVTESQDPRAIMERIVSDIHNALKKGGEKETWQKKLSQFLSLLRLR